MVVSYIETTTMAAAGKFIKDYPMAIGILLVLGGIGSIVMPTLTGSLSDRFGLFYGMAAIGVALTLMILCIFLYGYKEKEYIDEA